VLSNNEGHYRESPILVVDDHPANLVAFQAALKPLGEPLVMASSGEEALGYAVRYSFALALLDVEMPRMSGLELASRLRAQTGEGCPPIIFLTAIRRDPEEILAGYARGAVDYLTKPVRPEILSAKVKVLLELHRQREQIREQASKLRRHELCQIEARNTEQLRRITQSMLQREQRAREDAEAASRTKDEFLATISHELRTPLNAILGWARMVRTGSLDPARLSLAMETIERSAQAQAKLIGDILDVSRIVTGKLRLQMAGMNLSAIVTEAIETVRLAAQAKGIELRWEPSCADVPMRGDPSRMQQVVWNLLSNAVKFTPKGGRVQVRLEQDGESARLTVADTGVGIASEFLPFVFDRFRQGNATMTRTHEGLGLGLSIVKHLVELHGGQVKAESPGHGQGAEFVVQLPVGSATEERSAIHEVAPFRSEDVARPAAPNLPYLGGVRVLFVDDHPEARALAEALFEQCGAAVVAVESVEQAMEALRECVPDVLISDIGLPGEDGYSLIRRVRALDPAAGGAIPAIALTAYARPEDERRSRQEGFHVHLAKPIEPDELAALVADLIERKGHSDGASAVPWSTPPEAWTPESDYDAGI
jgi:signal transduction histidine kinase